VLCVERHSGGKKRNQKASYDRSVSYDVISNVDKISGVKNDASGRGKRTQESGDEEKKESATGDLCTREEK